MKSRVSIAFVIAAVLSFTLPGCSVIAPKVGPQMAKAVNKYCTEPYAERLLVRQSVNTQIAPNKVQVTCEGDPQ